MVVADFSPSPAEGLVELPMEHPKGQGTEEATETGAKVAKEVAASVAGGMATEDSGIPDA